MGSKELAKVNSDDFIDGLNGLKHALSAIEDGINDLLKLKIQLRNNEFFTQLYELIEKIKNIFVRIAENNNKLSLELTFELVIQFAHLHIQLVQVQIIINNLRIVEVRESIIVDSTAQSIEKALLKLIEFENHNILHQFGYDKYSNELIDKTKADIDRIMKLKELDKKPVQKQLVLDPDKYDDLYKVSDVKEYFKESDSDKIAFVYNASNIKHPFDINNHDVFDSDTGELIKRGTQTDYNSDFLLKLDHLYILDVQSFLDYQYQHTSNKKRFIHYVKYGALFSELVTNEAIKECIKDWLKNCEKSKNVSSDVQLETHFERISDYKMIMELLVYKEYIYPNTYLWIDNKKGNKSIMAAILKDLFAKGYYKSNRQLTNQQIVSICEIAFGVLISLDTVKRVTPEKFDLEFIPLKSTLK